MKNFYLKNNALSRRLMQFVLLSFLGMASALPSHATSLPCEIMLGQAEVNYGAVNAYDVNPRRVGSGKFSVGKQMTTLNVICTEPTKFAVVFRGPVSTEKYGFGTADGNGVFSLVLTQAQADGKPVTWASSIEASRNKPRIRLAADMEARPLVAGQVAPAPISRLTAVVEIDTKMTGEQTTKLKSDFAFTGRGSFELVPL